MFFEWRPFFTCLFIQTKISFWFKGKYAIALPRKVKSLSEVDFNLFFSSEVVSSVAFWWFCVHGLWVYNYISLRTGFFSNASWNNDDDVIYSFDVPGVFYLGHYRRVPIVATLVSLGISSLWGSLLSGNRNRLQIELAWVFSPNLNEEHKIKKEQHFVCIPHV